MNFVKSLKKLRDREAAEKSKRFFKTSEGEYGYGDLFLGISMPVLRNFSKNATYASLAELEEMVSSKYHEIRMAGFLILLYKFQKEKSKQLKSRYFNFYCQNFKYVNNWDIVDVTCPGIVGAYLLEKDKSPLKRWAKSNHLWTRRISVVSTWWFIRNNETTETFNIAKILITDNEDLIHKAVGWMLREAGKKDKAALVNFLKGNYDVMPRTMLRYAIEKFPEKTRKRYLKGKFK